MTMRFGDWVCEEMVMPFYGKERSGEITSCRGQIINLGCPDVIPMASPYLGRNSSSIISLLNEVGME